MTNDMSVPKHELFHLSHRYTAPYISHLRFLQKRAGLWPVFPILPSNTTPSKSPPSYFMYLHPHLPYYTKPCQSTTPRLIESACTSFAPSYLPHVQAHMISIFPSAHLERNHIRSSTTPSARQIPAIHIAMHVAAVYQTFSRHHHHHSRNHLLA